MKRVLIADDSLTVARQLERIVNSTGEFVTIGHARNGAEAIRLNQTENPDIILLDMNMPVMDGLTALRNLAALDPEAKVVMVTSLGGVGDKYAEAIKLGARSVISKPFEAENVLQVLRSL